MEEFQKLGSSVERCWREKNYSEEAFPEIAAAALAEAELVERIDPWEIIRWVHGASSLPVQQDIEGHFGDPPVTLFNGSRFYIDVYFWLDGTTSIHQHGFTGAFQVLLGSSIHSHYSFSEDQIINEHFSIGRIELKDVQLLKKTDVRPIRPGNQFIHSLFHLDRPSATITIRTEHTPSHAVQYDYRKPCFALNPFFKNTLMTKQIQTVRLLLQMKHKQSDEMIGDLLSKTDFHTAFFLMAETFDHLRHNQMEALFGLSEGHRRFDALLEKCREKHGAIADLILPVLQEQERQLNLVRRRSTITGDEHRFFLALLLNVPSRSRILELVTQRFPERDPVEAILDWVEELSAIRVLGSSEPNALGMILDQDHLFVLEGLLRGSTPADIQESVRTKYPEGMTDLIRSRIPAICTSFQESSLFRSMVG